MRIAHSWGIQRNERDIVFPCDDIESEFDSKCTLSIKPSSGYPLEILIVSNMIIKQESNSCRLICKANMKYRQSLVGYIAKRFFLGAI